MRTITRGTLGLIRFRLALLPLAAGILAACTSFSTIETSHLASTEIHPDKITGIPYYLPIGRIHITGTPPGANSNSKPPTSNTGSATPTPSPGQATTPSPTDTTQAINQSGYTINVSVDIQADPSHEYYLKPDRNYFYDDTTAITVGSTTGLLTTGNATATDQTVGIISAVASLIPQGALRAGPKQTNPFISDLRALLATEPAAYALESSALNTGLVAKIDQALAADSLGSAGAFKTEIGTRTPTTVADLTSYVAKFSSNQKAKNTYNLLFAYFAANPTLQKLAQSINPPLFPDSYPVPATLFADLNTALTTQDMLKPATSSQTAIEGTLQTMSQQNSATIGDLTDFLGYFPQDQPAGNAFSLLSKQLLATQSAATKPFDISFDPYVPSEVDDAIKNVETASGGIVMTCDAGTVPYAAAPPKLGFDGSTPDVNGKRAVAGIAFRPGVAWVLTFKLKSNLNRTQTLILPDKSSPPLLIDYDRMPFVSKVTNVAFSNGMLTSINSTVPSPILEFLGIPKAILQAILPIPQSPAPSSGTAKAAN